MDPQTMKMLAVGLTAGLGLLGPALGIGLIGFSALQGIARNPEKEHGQNQDPGTDRHGLDDRQKIID